MGRALGALLVVALAVPVLVGLDAHPAAAAPATPSNVDTGNLVLDGRVESVDVEGDVAYLGGSFTHVGARTGAYARTDASGANVAGMPEVAGGYVRDIVADGSGGIFIGGSFTYVGGIPRNRIAHIESDGTLDPFFNPNANNSVETMLLHDGVLYVGGVFTSIGGATRNRAAALDPVTGVVQAGFNPNLSNTVRTLAIAPDGTTMYLGGDFLAVNGSIIRLRAAQVYLANGAATAWNPDVANVVYSLAVSTDGQSVYLAGFFLAVNGLTIRNRIAAVDAVSGALTAWNPNANSNVYTLSVDNGTVYAGGMFGNIGGQARLRIAALSEATGLATAWNPGSDGTVYDLVPDGTTVYGACACTAVGGATRSQFFALDATVNTNNATAWAPAAGGTGYTVLRDGAETLIGGNFQSSTTVTRNRLAAVDLTTMSLTSWNPNANNTVLSVTATASTVYVGGSFTTVNGATTRNRIAALDTNGTATAWNPNANNVVYTLALDGTTMYAGGQFTSIGGQTRNRAAALDTTVNTNQATAWNPNLNNIVNDVKVGAATVYLGGIFTTVGGATRNRIAAVDKAAGAYSAWNPNANSTVEFLWLDGTTLYAAGAFTNIGGLGRNRLAALDTTVDTNQATAWNPNVNSTVRALWKAGDIMYVAGDFTTVNGSAARSRLAGLDTTVDTNQATAWNPGANGAGYAINGESANWLLAGGDWLAVGGRSAQGMAAFAAAGAAPTNSTLPTLGGTAAVGHTVATTSTGTWTGDVAYYGFQWRRCNLAGGACVNISGATGSTYVPVNADAGSTLRVNVTAYGQGGSAAAESSQSAVVPPVNTVLPTVTGTTTRGQTLTSTNGTWSPAAGTTYTRQWRRCDNTGSNCADIAGATATTYVLAEADVGSTIRVNVTSTINTTAVSTTATTNATAVVAPTVPVNSVLPAITGTAQDTQLLTASNGSWTGPPSSYTYQWRRCDNAGNNCADIAGATANPYTVQAADVAGTIRVVVTAVNVAGSTPATSAATAVVLPLPPGVTVLPTISGTAQQDQVLSTDDGTWTGPPDSFAYQWRRCNAAGAACSDIGGATANTYTAQAADVDGTIRVVVTATNAGGSTPATSAATAVVVPPAPVNTVPPAVSGTTQDGQVLSTSTGSWTDNPTAYAYQWRRCDGAGNNCVDIAGATANTYTLTAADVAATIRVRVSASNAGGSTDATSDATAVVLPLPPGNTTLPVVTGTVQEGALLAVSTGTWTNSPTGYTYQWQRCDALGGNCDAIAGETNDTYTLTAADVALTVRAEVTAVNDGGSTAAASAPTSIVLPLPPANTVPPVITGTVQDGYLIAVSTGTWTNSPTGYSYQWRRCDGAGGNCADIAGATSASYTLVAADVDGTVRAVVVALNDGGTSAPAVSGASSVVLPRVPVNTVAPTVAGVAQVGQVLTAGTGVWDPTPVSYAYTWMRCDAAGNNCTDVGTGPQYTPGGTDVDARIRVRVDATNTGGTGQATSTPTVAVLPAAPTNTAPPTITGTARVGETLTHHPASWTGTVDTITLVWERCSADATSCQAIPGATASTYQPVNTDAGSRVRVVETAANPGDALSVPSAVTLIVAATTPDAPLNLRVTRGDGSAIVTWDPPDDDGGAPITGYTITVQPGDRTITVDATTHTLTINDLDPDTDYTFSITAHNDAGSTNPDLVPQLVALAVGTSTNAPRTPAVEHATRAGPGAGPAASPPPERRTSPTADPPAESASAPRDTPPKHHNWLLILLAGLGALTAAGLGVIAFALRRR